MCSAKRDSLPKRLLRPQSTTPRTMAIPLSGDRILIFKDSWLTRILKRRKTLEIRGRALRAGTYWLGSKGVIPGSGPSIQLDGAALLRAWLGN